MKGSGEGRRDTIENVSPRDPKAKRWSGHMVSLLWTKSSRACLIASIRLTAVRGTAAGAPPTAPAGCVGCGDAVEVEPEDAAAADFISARASRSTSTQKRISSAGRRPGGSE
jgi:hypothetical protein